MIRRGAAFLLDQLILANAWLLFSSWAVVLYLSVTRRPGDLLSLTALGGFLAVLGVLLRAIYWIVFVGGCGQTPGKMALGLQVVRRDGRAVRYGRAASRWIGTGLAALPLGLGFLGLLVTREKRGLHDWLAGTRVVRAAAR
ncbi:MAG: RDD family protein [Candidatus Methylomirabilia bacterium]